MISPRALFLCAALGLQMLLPPVFAAPGDLDLTFGRTGKFTTDFGSVSDQGRSVAVQGDGRIVVTGKVDGPNDLDVGIARYLADGTLDPSFGAGGKVVTDFGGGNDSGEAVAIQSDGKIVVACLAYDGGNPRIGVARYLTNGTLDPAFNGTGQVITVLGTHDGAQAVAIQDDGKIVVAGFATVGSFTDFAVLRYEANGTLDTGFGTGGSVITDIGTINDEATSVAIQADGKIVAAGYADIGSFVDFAVLRYEADGDLDPTWNTSGIVTTDISGLIDQGFSVIVQSQDQKIVVAGVSNTGSDHDFALVRYTTNGVLDGTFGTGGIVVVPQAGEQFFYGLVYRQDGSMLATGFSDLGGDANTVVLRFGPGGAPDLGFGNGGEVIVPISNGNDHGNSIFLQSDDRAVIAGFAETGANSDFALLRLLHNGRLDDSFGPGTGKVVRAAGSGDNFASGVALQNDGKIVVAGAPTNNMASDDFVVTRYTATGAVDTSFGGGTGQVTTPIGSGADAGPSVAVQGDGKIVSAGYTNTGGNLDIAVVRQTSTGALDSGFGGGTGKVTTPIAAGNGFDVARGVVVQSDQKIVVAGTSYDGSSFAFAVVRYATTGALDSAFGGGSGNVTTAFGGTDATGNSVAIQRDGKIVVAGYFFDGVDADFALARYTTAGELDLSFGGGTGKVTTDFGGNDDVGFSVAIQDDGKIVVGGYSNNGSNTDFALARYTDTGVPDPSFGGGTGKATMDFGSGDDQINSVVLQNDGKIVVGGYCHNATDGDFLVVRYTSTGAFDTSFGGGTGKVTLDFGGRNDAALSLKMQSDGKFVVAGSSRSGANYDSLLVRLLGDPIPVVTTEAASGVQARQATLSATVNPNGQATMVHFEYGTDPALAGASSTTAFGIGAGTDPLPEDQVATGLTPNTTYYFRVVATNVAGTSFGDILSFATSPSVPAVTTLAADNVRSFSARLHAVVDPYGQVTTGIFEYGLDPTLGSASMTAEVNLGSAQGPVSLEQSVTGLEHGRTYYYRAVAANATGPNFGTILSFTTATVPGDAAPGFAPTTDTEVQGAVVQPDGKIIIGGSFTTVNGVARNHLARLLVDGTLDPTFDPGVDGTIYSLTLQPDGSLILGGAFTNVAGVARSGLARLLPDGSVDASFNPSPNDEVRSVAVQIDGSLIIGGHFTTVAGVTRNRVARLLATGTLDAAFDPNVNERVRGVTVQPDGRILIGGFFTTVGGTTRNRITRLEADGTLDAGFDPNVADFAVFGTTVQPDGKIIVGGFFTTVGGVPRRALARLEANGTLDAAFNPAGVVGDVYVTLLQADGKIVVGGNFDTAAGVTRHGVVRLLADGTPDPSFNPDVTGGATFTAVYGMAARSDGKIVISGRFTTVGTEAHQNLALLANDPAPQSLTVSSAARVEWLRGGTSPETRGVTFDLSTTGGLSWTPLGAGTRIAGGWELTGLALPASGAVRARAHLAGGIYNGSSSFAETTTIFPKLDLTFAPNPNTDVQTMGVQPDGQVVIGGGFSSVGGMTRQRLARLGADGALDVSFDPSVTGGSGEMSGTLVQADGKIVVAGSFDTVGGVTRTGLARLNADGTPEIGFDPAPNNSVFALAEQPDGKLLIGGRFTFLGAVFRTRIARLNADGSVDMAFDPGVPDLAGVVDCFAVQADGKILVGGFFSTIGGSPRSCLARLNPDGTLDAAFQPDPDGEVYSIVVQPDGRIVVAGGFDQIGGFARGKIARLNADGSVDASFDPVVNNEVDALALQADGGILVAGLFTTIDNISRPRIARLTPEGAVDPGFNPGADAFIYGLAVQADGRVLVGGGFTMIDGVARTGIARLQNDPTTGSLTPTSLNRVLWRRGGTAPEVSAVTFELTLNGTDFTPLGAGTRTAGGWELTGLALPGGGQIRARGRTSGGFANGSTGLVETVAPFQFAGTDVATSVTATGATLRGSVNPNGITTTAHFEYGTNSNLSGATATSNVSLGNGTVAVPVQASLTGLVPGVTYYYRVVVDNGGTTIYGDILSFVTLDGVLAGPIVNPITGNLYYLLSHDSWTQSEARAVALGGHLVTINDAAENQWVSDTFNPLAPGSAQGLWLGLNDVAQEGAFVWVSGDPVTFTGFRPGQPDNAFGTQDFAILEGGTTWDDISETDYAPNVFGVVEVPAVGVVINTGGDVPGEMPGTTFVDFGSPAIDAGQVGGAAIIKETGKKAVTVIYGDAEGTVLARTGEPTDDGITFLSLGDPVFAGEGFGFTGVARVNATSGLPLLIDPRLGVADLLRGITPRPGAKLAGLFSQIARASGIKQLARQGGSAPGVSGGTFTKLPTFALPRKRAGLVFTGNLKRGNGVTKANDFGVWRETAVAGESELIVRHGETIGTAPAVQKLELMIPVANATDQRRSFAPDGGLAASAKLAGGVIGVVRVMADGTKDVPIDSTTDVPGLPGARFSKVSAPATGNRGIAAFHAALRAAAAGQPPPASQVIVTNRDGAFRTVVRIGESIPGNNAQRFSRLGQPLMGQDGLLAFIASLKGTGVTKRNGTALVQINGNDERRVIARLGDPAPGFEPGAVFQRLQSVVVTDTLKGHVVFTGLVSGGGVTKRNRQALWSVSGDNEVKLLLRGDQFVTIGTETPRLRVFDALTAKPASKGQGRSTDDVGFVTAKVKLSDGRSGVLRIPLP